MHSSSDSSGHHRALHSFLHDALPISKRSQSPSLSFMRSRRGSATPRYSASEGSRRLHSTRSRRSEEHTSELQSHSDLVCRLLLEKKKLTIRRRPTNLTTFNTRAGAPS